MFDNIGWATYAHSRVKDCEAKRRPKATYQQLISMYYIPRSGSINLSRYMLHLALFLVFRYKRVC